MKKSFTKDILCQLPEEGGGAWQMLNIADEWGGVWQFHTFIQKFRGQNRMFWLDLNKLCEFCMKSSGQLWDEMVNYEMGNSEKRSFLVWSGQNMIYAQ